MIKYLKEYFYERASNSKRVHPIYILPTIDGLKVIALNLILLILGLVYANNYILLFNFILFCLFLGSMFYTHFNLSGLTLKSAQFPPLYVNESGLLNLSFKSSNAQGHYFIRPYFKSSTIKLLEPNKTFPISSKDNTVVNISIQAISRGHDNIKSIYIETLFPFNFFRCFTFFKIDQSCLIYPERSDLRLHEEIELIEEGREEGDDFFIREYQIGDSLKRVDWKKLAQTNRWYTRQFQTARPNPILLILNETPLEDTLKSICFTMHILHQQDVKYGLKLGHKILISPDHSSRHLNNCLRELARYEA